MVDLPQRILNLRALYQQWYIEKTLNGETPIFKVCLSSTIVQYQHTNKKDNPMLNNYIEEWKPIPGFEKLYEASTYGHIRNSRGKIMKTYKINSGYHCIKFTVNNIRNTFLVHRLIASTFLGVFIDRPEVNHRNENKDDNSLLNLDWETRSGNKQHSMRTGTYECMYTARNSLGKKHLPKTTSKYHNVSYDKYRNKWRGCIRDKGKNVESKRFNTEEEAALHVNYLIDKYGFHDRTRNIIV